MQSVTLKSSVSNKSLQSYMHISLQENPEINQTKKVTGKLKTSPLIPSSATDLILLIIGEEKSLGKCRTTSHHLLLAPST